MQGYITIATGPAKYLAMAANFAASLKVMDPGRRVCVLHDPGADIPDALRRVCDDLLPLEPDARYPSVTNKFRLPGISPYDATMFVDADCLLVKRDIDDYWRAASAQPFAITGAKRTDGEWKGRPIADILREQGVPYLVQMNGGVFYFDRSPASRALFADLNEFYLERKESLRVATHGGTRHYSDELFFGVFMGLRGLAPIAPGVGDASWMVSTWRALYCSFDPARGKSLIVKPTGHLWGLPFLPTGVRLLSPSFAHFVGLKPRRTYDRLSAWFHERAKAAERV